MYSGQKGEIREESQVLDLQHWMREEAKKGRSRGKNGKFTFGYSEFKFPLYPLYKWECPVGGI